MCLILVALIVIAFSRQVNAQPKQVCVSGTDFVIYTDLGLGFQSGSGTQIMTIEILNGTWIGENCRLGVTERGGELYFEPNSTCQFQLTNYAENSMRLYYEGFALDTLTQGFSYNGTFTGDGNPDLLHWSWGFLMPHEENWDLFMGILGIALLIIGLLLLAFLVRTVPIFSLRGEILFDKISFAVAIALIIIGFGFIMMWLLA